MNIVTNNFVRKTLNFDFKSIMLSLWKHWSIKHERANMNDSYDLMGDYLTDARLTTVTRRERLCELGGLEHLLNPCVWLDTRLHPGLEPGVGSSKYSVTQSPPWDYRCVMWWDSGQILRNEPRRKEKSGNSQVVPISATPVFPDFPIFLFSPTFPSSRFWWSDCLLSEGNQKHRLFLGLPLLRLS